ncbi:MAG: hypothetical protein IKD97_04670 [Firmicutes bacterium]|nr:hypothetical protein [Bacillota bacterium]
MDEQNRIYIEKEPSMKYFNFIMVAVWFLFLRAFVSIGNGKAVMDSLMNTPYGLQGVIMFATIVISAIGFLYAAINIKKYQWNGVIGFLAGIVCNIIFYVVDLYFFLLSDTFNAEFVSDVILLAIFVIIFVTNNSYFKKRRSLFQPYTEDYYTVEREESEPAESAASEAMAGEDDLE